MKERITDTMRNFFIVVTLINAAMLVLGAILRPDQQFGYEAFAYPIIYGFITSIPGLFMGTSKEMSVAQAVIREIIQLMLIIVALLVIMFGGNIANKDNIIPAISVTVSVIIVFVLVNLISWGLDKRTAEKMTADLEAYQRKNMNF
ncbi:hypothetical protein [Butyrivibrio sp. WCD3002]|uniref:hypothetical protein n=1 Tax=Butyrivibrio sp. WCD3002 TaxID=1280676 RepID=UPI0004066B85|nr:hypothetical protein [Butyrivibrio sp. WCD3002]